MPVSCFRHWCSSGYLSISPLHPEFHSPLTDSRKTVSKALPRLSPGIPLQTDLSACAPFTPSKSEQRLEPPYYRGCWHGVSRSYSCGTVRPVTFPSPDVLPTEKSFTTRRPSSLTRHGCVRLSPIAQYSSLLPPVGVWTVSQFQCGRSTSQLGYPSLPW